MADFRRYTVDLSLPPEERWDELLTDTWAKGWARKLAQRAYDEAPGGPLKPAGKWLISSVAQLRSAGLEYKDEVEVWSKYCMGDRDLAYAVNMSYEILPGACSSVAFSLPGQGMVHARNLDWPLTGMIEATILIDFINAPAGNFTAVSVPGLVGVISGVAKGRFSITINQPLDRTGIDILGGWSVPWLLRHTFENCRSYKEAVKEVSTSRTVRPVYVQIVGCKAGEACVIEVNNKEDNAIYEYDGEPLGLTNHSIGDPDYEDECDEDGCTESLPRLECIVESAAQCRSKTVAGVLSILQKPPVLWDDTQQSMVFCPKTGQVYLRKLS